ncbi:MAG: hypothetical protein ACR2IE_14800 [Candidatus Sumerlaeaceae bacterium]
MNWSIWSASLVVQIIELMLAGALFGLGLRARPDSVKQEGSAIGHILALLFLLLPVGLAGWVSALLVRGNRAQDLEFLEQFRSTNFLAAAGVVLLPQVLIHGGLSFTAYLRGSQIAFLMPVDMRRVRRRKQRILAGVVAGKLVLLVSSLVTLLHYVLLLPPLETLAPVVALMLAAGVAIWTCRANASIVDESPRSEITSEQTELQIEVLKIARAFGWRPKSILMFKILNKSAGSPGRDGDIEQLVAGLDRWRNTFNPKSPALPEELLLNAPQEAIAVGLAMRFANAALLNPLRWTASGSVPFWAVGVVMVILLLLFAGGLFAMLQAFGSSPGESFVIGSWLAAFIALVVGVISLMMRRRGYHRMAYEAWRNAGPENADRSPEAFVTALIEFDCAMKPTINREQIVARLHKDQRLQAFLGSVTASGEVRAFAGGL